MVALSRVHVSFQCKTNKEKPFFIGNKLLLDEIFFVNILIFHFCRLKFVMTA